MGLIDFVKEAGEKLKSQAAGLFGGNAEKEAEAAADLVSTVNALGLPVEDLAVAIKKDVATVTGTTPSQEDREKVVLVVGNTKGIAQVDDRLKVVKPEPEATFYTVQRGDSLSKIAKAQYGNAMKYPVIFEANRPMLSDPDKIYPGQVLRIPPQK